jgi:hypothetical protein
MARVRFTIGVAVCGPIEPKTYEVGRKSVAVSYPERFIIQGPHPVVMPLPAGRSTQFVVEWEDRGGAAAAALRSQSYERYLVVYQALDAISELLLAFKLVRIGNIDGRGLRTIGIGDTLYFFAAIDGVETGLLNVGMRQVGAPIDPYGTTALALPHVGSATFPLARRYVRCFELVEHGFYTEAFLAAFVLLDDFVQQTLSEQLEAKGLASKADRTELMRGIKENRLRVYLGPLLMVTSGRDIQSMWPQASAALEWLNSTRNRIAHAAESIDRSSAARAIFVSLKILICLRDAGLARVDIPVELFREAKLMAAWTLAPPAWVPQGGAAETMDFNS